MAGSDFEVSRRHFLGASAAGLGTLGTLAAQDNTGETARPGVPARPLRVAGINSIYGFRSHAYHIEGRLIHGYTRNGFHHQPQMKLVRMFNDQYPTKELGRETCQTHGIELCDTIPQALGGDTLDVDAVLLIVEHGDYPVNQRQQVLYPRFEFFQQIVDVFRKSGRSVPVFVDKHLSYDAESAHKMVAWSKELKFPLFAGSSLPVTWRIPAIEPPLETPFTEGVAIIGFDRGAVDIYLFHVLEVLQSMLERRVGGETGVKSVRCLKGPAVWEAGDQGLWSWDLLRSALAVSPSCNVGDVKGNVKEPLVILVEYNDGTRGAVFNLIEQTSEFAFSGRVKGREAPISCSYYLPPPPAAKFFNPLTWHIEQFCLTGQPSYPAERTLLTSSVLDFAMRSLEQGGQTLSSPLLDVRYAPPVDSGFFRDPVTDAGFGGV